MSGAIPKITGFFIYRQIKEHDWSETILKVSFFGPDVMLIKLHPSILYHDFERLIFAYFAKSLIISKVSLGFTNRFGDF